MYHEQCDINGYFTNMIYPLSHCKIILNASLLSFFTGMFALYQQKYSLALVPFSVGLTSQLYWRNPIHNSYMRYIDIGTVAIGLTYQLYYSYYNDKLTPYLITILLAISFYPLSNYFIRRHSWVSVFLYSLLHIVANIGNIILYL